MSMLEKKAPPPRAESSSSSLRASVTRALQKGNESEWSGLEKKYGRAQIVQMLKNEIAFIPDHAVRSICEYFSLQPKDLHCFKSNKLR